MKKIILSSIIALSCNIPDYAFCDGMYLYGNAQLITEDGKEIPARNIKKITVSNFDILPAKLRKDGGFTLDLTDKGLKAGDKIKLQVDCDGWSVYAPYESELYIPSDLEKEIINVKLIANKSEVSIDNYSAQFSAKDIYIVKGAGNYFVQVFATNSMEKAINIQNALVERGFVNSYYKEFRYVNNKNSLETYYKIVVGPYSTKENVIDAKNTINNYELFKKSYVIPWIN